MYLTYLTSNGVTGWGESRTNRKCVDSRRERERDELKDNVSSIHILGNVVVGKGEFLTTLVERHGRRGEM